MKITAGLAKNITLTPIQGDEIRPTLARTRQALFDSLGDLSGLCVIDLFAGAGGLGLEAISRGAKEVTFIEKNIKHCSIIEKNIKLIQNPNIHCNANVISADVLKVENWVYLTNQLNPNIIFADPPYNISANYFNLLKKNNKFFDFAKNSMLLWELPKNNRDTSFFDIGLWSSFHIKSYQNTKFLLIKI